MNQDTEPKRCKSCGAFKQRGRCPVSSCRPSRKRDADIWRAILTTPKEREA